MSPFLKWGGGNRLLYIYASDGTDIGKKFLNVSEGSAISSYTGFLVADGNDVKTKLCGKGLNTISYTIYWDSSKYANDVYAYISFSGIPSGQTVAVTGSLTYTGTHEDKEGDVSVTRPFTINLNCSNGNTALAKTESVGNSTVWCTANLTLAFGSRSANVVKKSFYPVKQTTSGTL